MPMNSEIYNTFSNADITPYLEMMMYTWDSHLLLCPNSSTDVNILMGETAGRRGAGRDEERERRIKKSTIVLDFKITNSKEHAGGGSSGARPKAVDTNREPIIFEQKRIS